MDVEDGRILPARLIAGRLHDPAGQLAAGTGAECVRSGGGDLPLAHIVETGDLLSVQIQLCQLVAVEAAHHHMAVLYVEAVAGALLCDDPLQRAVPPEGVQMGAVPSCGDKVADPVLHLHGPAAAQAGVAAHAAGVAAVVILGQQLQPPVSQAQRVEVHVPPGALGILLAGRHNGLVVGPQSDHPHPAAALLQQAPGFPGIQIVQIDAGILAPHVRPREGLVEDPVPSYGKTGHVRRLLRYGPQLSRSGMVQVQAAALPVGEPPAVGPERELVDHLIGRVLLLRLLQLAGCQDQIAVLIHGIDAPCPQRHSKCLDSLAAFGGNLIVAGFPLLFPVPGRGKQERSPGGPGITLPVARRGQPCHLAAAQAVEVEIPLVVVVLQVRVLHHKCYAASIRSKGRIADKLKLRQRFNLDRMHGHPFSPFLFKRNSGHGAGELPHVPAMPLSFRLVL